MNRESFDDLEQALESAREAAEGVIAEGPLAKVKAIRDYDPSRLVNARIEISGKGIFSPPTAGIDIQGDLSVVPYSGGMIRRSLEGSTVPEAIESVRMSLS